MRISKYFGLKRGHVHLEFVDIDTGRDTQLFIDPCLIETGTTLFCQSAAQVMDDYFTTFYALYRNHTSVEDKLTVFEHAHEINATKLGYGSGKNGKAKTAEGMLVTFAPLQSLVDRQMPLFKAIDLSTFVRDFAEDCLSDMLTNILFAQLSEYTVELCQKYSKPLENVPPKYYYWDTTSHGWALYQGQGLFIDGELVLLVPKNIVRHAYYYRVDHYFRSIILEKKQEERTTYDSKGKKNKPSKEYLRTVLLHSHSDVLDVSTEETLINPNLLVCYHEGLPSAYRDRGMSDKGLDYWTYRHRK